ncbi:MAG: CBS domain-containing protein [Cenarchaeum sp. SB0663_bin_5]|nr:CBS domain-containing protein [Cenarchaeum sp. SB0663_bin_5]MYH03863.1 CBS domain-containing protein [Cenarchaeum sp. SB0675_bin_21]MYL11914.1 CBS domain-containing protein [Cenarchaeum sp. SB0669_bin_11]
MSTEQAKAAEYIQRKSVTTCMKRNVLQMSKDTSTRVAADRLREHELDEILVVEDEKCIGIVTDKDILSKVSDVNVDAESTTLEDIMVTPVISIRKKENLHKALEIMKDTHHNKLPVTDRRGRALGIIHRREILDRVQWAASQATPRLMSPPAKAILGNLGFVLQFAGVLLLLPALVSTFMGDTVTATGIYLSLVLLLVVGFFLNSYGEKARMNMRQASVVVLSSLFLLSLFGTIPYLYLPSDIQLNGTDEITVDTFASAFFSSAAGFTTGGISLYDTPEDLPQSFTFYRSYTQMIGGMSFIYLVITAFYPNSKLASMRSFITGKGLHMRELFGTITIIFTLYVTVIALLLYLMGDDNIIDDFSLAMSTLATGGFVPHSEIVQNMEWPKQVVLMSAMLLGTLPFALHYGMVSKRGRLPVIGREVSVYFAMLAIAIIIFAWVGGTDILNSAFYAISASTTAGVQPSSLADLAIPGQYILIVLMLIGGCGFSTAGGIKMFRLFYLVNAFKMILPKSRSKVSAESRRDIRAALIVVSAFPIIAFLCGAYLVEFEGADPDLAFFDAVGIITTGGLSTGVIDFETSAHTKILLSMLMIFGRLEIIALVYVIAPRIIGRN